MKQTTSVPEFRHRIFIIFVTRKSKCFALRFWIVLEKTTSKDSPSVCPIPPLV